MRAIQAGILICLMAMTGLLVAIYRQQGQVGPAAVEERAQDHTPPLEVPEIPPVEELVPIPEPVPPAPAKVRPSPGRASAAPARKAAPPASAPPVREPEPPPALEPPRVVPPPETAMAPLPPLETGPPLQEEVPAEPRQPRVVTLPAGQALTVRLDNTLSTSRSRVDDTFFATLNEAVVVNGLIIAERGARVEGRVVEVTPAGRVKGVSRLACELVYLHTDDGQRVAIRTSTFAQDGPRTRGEDLKKVGIGAGAGAILGAIFGGGKGAAIGAASGAGAGAGTAAMTRGEPVVLEPETRLDFRLAEGVTITEKL